MIKALTVMGALLASSPRAQNAPADKFLCLAMGGVDEWKVAIDLESARAAYFNEEEAVGEQGLVRPTILLLKEFHTNDARPNEWIYTFEQIDTKGKMEVAFNKTKLSATMTLNVGTPEQRSYRNLEACRADDSYRF